jgi:hypothetical protein
MLNVDEKILKAIIKDGMTKWVKSQAPKLGLHKIIDEHDDNLKTTFEMMLQNEC